MRKLISLKDPFDPILLLGKSEIHFLYNFIISYQRIENMQVSQTHHHKQLSGHLVKDKNTKVFQIQASLAGRIRFHVPAKLEIQRDEKMKFCTVCLKESFS